MKLIGVYQHEASKKWYARYDDVDERGRPIPPYRTRFEGPFDTYPQHERLMR